MDVSSHLKLPEVAMRLGVSEKTARRYIKSGTLPSIFVGNAYRVHPDDLAAFVDRARVTEPQAPNAQEQLPLEHPVPGSLKEALEWTGASSRLLALPREEFEELYADATPEEVAGLNQDLVQERQLIKPILYQWRTMPPSEERSRLYALWQESLIRLLTATNAAERADVNAVEVAQELASV